MRRFICTGSGRSQKTSIGFEEPESISPVLADKNRMRQVFVNVIDNALKYTPEDGMVSIRVQEDEKFIHIYIVDNGCGIRRSTCQSKDKFVNKANRNPERLRHRIGGGG